MSNNLFSNDTASRIAKLIIYELKRYRKAKDVVQIVEGYVDQSKQEVVGLFSRELIKMIGLSEFLEGEGNLSLTTSGKDRLKLNATINDVAKNIDKLKIDIDKFIEASKQTELILSGRAEAEEIKPMDKNIDIIVSEKPVRNKRRKDFYDKEKKNQILNNLSRLTGGSAKKYKQASLFNDVFSAVLEDVTNKEDQLKRDVNTVVAAKGIIAFYFDKTESTIQEKRRAEQYALILDEAIAQLFSNRTELMLMYGHLGSGNLARSMKFNTKIARSSQTGGYYASIIAKDTSRRKYGYSFEHGHLPITSLTNRTYNDVANKKRRAKRKGDSFKFEGNSMAKNIYDWILAKEQLGIWQGQNFANDKERIKAAYAIRFNIIKNGYPASYDTHNRVQKKKPNNAGMIEYLIDRVFKLAQKMARKDDSFKNRLSKTILSYKKLRESVDGLKPILSAIGKNIEEAFDFGDDVIKYSDTKTKDIAIKDIKMLSANSVKFLSKKVDAESKKMLNEALRSVRSISSFKSKSSSVDSILGLTHLLQKFESYF